MTVNKDLLEKTMTHVKDHPEVHDQGTWVTKTSCGTAACFAGWATLLAGCELGKDMDSPLTASSLPRVRDKAIEVLGISEGDANILFHGSNSRAELELMVKDLLNGEPLRDHWKYCYDRIAGTATYRFVGWERDGEKLDNHVLPTGLTHGE